MTNARSEACEASWLAGQLPLRPLDDRMQAIPVPDDHPAWLSEDAVREVAKALRRCPSEAMRAYRASRRSTA
jgi:hypothetical protein